MIDVHPTKCNLCGGEVVYTSNAKVYGREFGSGRCYLCMSCGAYVGTHKPRPRDALGILADAEMRYLKRICHAVFDPMWQGDKHPQRHRREMYAWLAEQMGIPASDCHFGYFDADKLRIAHKILLDKSRIESSRR